MKVAIRFDRTMQAQHLRAGTIVFLPTEGYVQLDGVQQVTCNRVEGTKLLFHHHEEPVELTVTRDTMIDTFVVD